MLFDNQNAASSEQPVIYQINITIVGKNPCHMSKHLKPQFILHDNFCLKVKLDDAQIFFKITIHTSYLFVHTMGLLCQAKLALQSTIHQCKHCIDFKFELFLLRLPLPRETLLISFPTLIDSLKFSG